MGDFMIKMEQVDQRTLTQILGVPESNLDTKNFEVKIKPKKLKIKRKEKLISPQKVTKQKNHIVPRHTIL